MNKANTKQNDAELIQRRTAAWNNRPIISSDMWAKTSWEHKLINKLKSRSKRYLGKRDQIKLQETIMRTDLKNSPIMANATLSFTKIVL